MSPFSFHSAQLCLAMQALGGGLERHAEHNRTLNSDAESTTCRAQMDNLLVAFLHITHGLHGKVGVSSSKK